MQFQLGFLQVPAVVGDLVKIVKEGQSSGYTGAVIEAGINIGQMRNREIIVQVTSGKFAGKKMGFMQEDVTKTGKRLSPDEMDQLRNKTEKKGKDKLRNVVTALKGKDMMSAIAKSNNSSSVVSKSASLITQ